MYNGIYRILVTVRKNHSTDSFLYMARIGLSYYEVADACDALVAEGQTPTIDRVAQLLKTTSSRTTINNHLKNWRALRESRAANRLPEPLSALLTDQTQRIYASVESSISAKFAQERDEYARQIQTLEDLVAGIRPACDQKDSTILERETEIAGLRGTIAKVSGELAEANTLLEEASTALATANGRITELQAALATQAADLAVLAQAIKHNADATADLTKAQNSLGMYVAGIGGDLPRLRTAQSDMQQTMENGFQVIADRLTAIEAARTPPAPRSRVLSKLKRSGAYQT